MPQTAQTRPASRPNILIFMTDQQQADVVLPDHPCQTPHAERLARDGVTFRRTFCPTAHCCPSRATFFTGLYPSRHGVFNNISTPTRLSRGPYEDVALFSEALRDAGYDLAFAGKWHVSDERSPADYGWRELEVKAGKGSYMHPRPQVWERVAAREAEANRNETRRRPGQIRRPGWGDLQLYETLPDSGATGYEDIGDCQTVRKAVAALPEMAAAGAPWCLFIGPQGPHDPYRVPASFVEGYRLEDIPLPTSYADTLADKPRIYQRMRRQIWDQLAPDEIRDAIRHYWAYCTMMDALLGEVLDALDATGQADNTLILFLSDHGDFAGAHGLFFKGIPAFREAYQVPCIARWPRGIAQPGRDVSAFVSLADFAPTFLDLAEAAPAPQTSGASLRPFFESDQRPDGWRDEIHAQMNGVELYYSQRSITTDQFKYVYNGFDWDELYDLRTDPDELNNVADAPEYADVKREMVRRMWRFATRQKDERLFNAYGTVALAPWGPADALGEREDAAAAVV